MSESVKSTSQSCGKLNTDKLNQNSLVSFSFLTDFLFLSIIFPNSYVEFYSSIILFPVFYRHTNTIIVFNVCK